MLYLLAGRRLAGSWASAAALAAYAVLFSWAYLRIGAGLGALVLFGAVQITMLGWGVARGERVRPAQAVGLALALGGLVALTLPGWRTRDGVGLVAMAAAGVAWGVYSLRGRGKGDPLAETAGNFVRTLPLAAMLVVIGDRDVSASGATLAVASGAVASGLGYVIWYVALRHLTAVRAAIAQLAVPVIAAAAGVVILAETPSIRLVAAGGTILLGVAIALVNPRR